MVDAYEFCGRALKQPSAGRLLLVFGGSGNGKSHVAQAIVRWVNAVGPSFPWTERGNVKHAEARFVNWPRVVDGFKQGEWSVVERLIKTHVIAVDDIGAEHDPSKIGIEKLYQLLTEREKKYTVMTTNLAPELWEERFERRITSRFLRNSVHVDLTQVPDYNA